MKEVTEYKTEKKFKDFNETYPICAFGLASGLIYPNKHNVIKRVIIGSFILFLNFPELLWFIAYLVKCVKTGDLYNFIRSMNVLIIITLFLFKSTYVNWKNNQFSELLQKISEDMLKGNDLEEDYQNIYEYHIKKAKFAQTVWVIIPLIFCVQFPLCAGIATIYESMKSDVGKRYMMQDHDLKYLENVQFETPYYEIIFAYNFTHVFTMLPNFVGFDGSFCIATTHLTMKLQLMVHKIKKSFSDSYNYTELREKIKEAVKDHQEAMNFYEQIQDVYGGWLLSVFTLTSFIIATNLYMIYLVGRLEPNYAIFAFSGVCHIYAPCYYAASLQEVRLVTMP